MTEQVATDGSDLSVARWLWHWLLLFAAMALPFFLLHPESACWVAISTGVAYFTWQIRLPQELRYAVRNLKQKRRTKRDPWTVVLVAAALGACGPIMAIGTIAALASAWAAWVFEEGWIWQMMTLILLMSVLAPALFIALMPALGRENGGPASQLLNSIHDRGNGRFFLIWFSEVPWELGLLCLLPIISFPYIHQIATALNGDVFVPIWDIAIAIPYLPATLLAAAVLLSMPRLAPYRHVESSILARTYPPALDSQAKKFLGLTSVGGAVATLFVILYPIHLGWVASKSSVVGLTPLVKTMEAVESSVTEQSEAGRSTAQIAAELNRIGSWTPDAPDAGLATLVEESDSVFVDTCRVHIAAGAVNPSNHGDFDRHTAEQAASDLKYCIAVSCASPALWDAPPALLLGSSHRSQAAGWSQTAFIDLFANGAARPGGYCTADGALANEFQG
jgi:hypothetical protein